MALDHIRVSSYKKTEQERRLRESKTNTAYRWTLRVGAATLDGASGIFCSSMKGPKGDPSSEASDARTQGQNGIPHSEMKCGRRRPPYHSVFITKLLVSAYTSSFSVSKGKQSTDP